MAGRLCMRAHPRCPDGQALAPAIPLNGSRLSLKAVSDKLAEAGYINERGQPCSRKSIMTMVDGPWPVK